MSQHSHSTQDPLAGLTWLTWPELAMIHCDSRYNFNILDKIKKGGNYADIVAKYNEKKKAIREKNNEC